MIRRPVLGLALVVALAGCRSCGAEAAPEDAVRDATKQALDASPSTLHTICGIRVSSLSAGVVYEKAKHAAPRTHHRRHHHHH
jgi:hypothetical protein